MQLSYGFLTRYVARPDAAGRRAAPVRYRPALGGLSQSVGQLLGSPSAWRASVPARSTRWATPCSRMPSRPSGAASPSAPTSAAATWAPILVPFVGGALLAGVGWQVTLALFGIPALVVGVLIALRVREDRAALPGQRPRIRIGLGAAARGAAAGVTCGCILGAALVAAGGRGLDIVAPFMLLYLSRPARARRGHHRLAVRAAAGGRRGRPAAGRLAVRSPRPSPHAGQATTCSRRWASCCSWRPAPTSSCWCRCCCRSARRSSASHRCSRRTWPIAPPDPCRDVAFSVYFTFAFGIGALWAFIIGSVVVRARLSRRVRRDGGVLPGGRPAAARHPRAPAARAAA